MKQTRVPPKLIDRLTKDPEMEGIETYSNFSVSTHICVDQRPGNGGD
ncbi:Uncharacterized protein dnm_053070 [Desulfonema magnum]|uniref:Uncharacterized protein n=1 Tax=Desulfonema magnum TaxID=45655 RepID=A0A975BPE2_9BACT|nr:Uncharacterized protein dnm_053070 [Desulfonema magnum]